MKLYVINHIFINGDLADATSAKISPFDRGFLFADGVYELIPFFSNKPFLLDEHYHLIPLE